MERQRAAARKAWAGSGEAATEGQWFELREKLGATEFLGYSTEVAEGKVIALLVDNKPVQAAEAGAKVVVIANQTPFYGESGGQMGDRGIMFNAGGIEIAINDTQKKLGDLFIHLGTVTKGTIAVGDVVEMRVDGERRTALRANHSATHLLHEALRRRLGTHVTQKGSLVAPDRLRFDFSHPKPLSLDDIRAIESEVNNRIRLNADVATRLMTPDDAVKAGALALFGEKYGDEVRVVSMGGADDGKHFSTELCGGTHVRRAGDIGFFKIVGEGAVAAGVRRIDALTGKGAFDYVVEREKLLAEAADALKIQPAELPGRIAALVEERRKLERELSDTRRALALGGSSGGKSANGDGAKDVAGVKFATRLLDGVPARELKSLADDLKKQIGSGVIAIVATHEGKAANLVAVTDDLKARFDARELVKAGVAALGGQGGGGRPDMAQGGGPAADQGAAALAAIERALRERAGA
jgi:alanyl-tRNA synthetase